MKVKLLSALALPMLLLAACEDEVEETAPTESGGEAAGEVLGGTISDDMIPLERLTSTSPPAEPSTSTATTTTVSEGEDGESVVETTVTTSSNDSDAPAPAPPETPATPE